jgi:hypothetical protein
MWLILCGANMCWDFLCLSNFNLLILYRISHFLVFSWVVSFYFVCTYVFVVDFVYVHSSPQWYWCCFSIVVLYEPFWWGLCVYIYCVWVGGSKSKVYLMEITIWNTTYLYGVLSLRNHLHRFIAMYTIQEDKTKAAIEMEQIYRMTWIMSNSAEMEFGSDRLNRFHIT